jgi:hypothetical protein
MEVRYMFQDVNRFKIAKCSIKVEILTIIK